MNGFRLLCTAGLLAASAQAAPVALVQYNADRFFGDANLNVQKLTGWAREAADGGAAMVVFPEGSTFGYATAGELWCRPGMGEYEGRQCRDVASVAQAIPGGWLLEHWKTVAREEGIAVVFQTPEIERGRAGEAYYNTLVGVSPSGDVTRYRKRILYYLDEAYAEPGSASAMFSSPVGNLGMLVCADANSLSYFEDYKRQGAKGVVVSMDWDQSPSDPSRSARAFFSEISSRAALPLLVSDVSPWDGTGGYFPGGPRVRMGLSEPGVGKDGIAWVDF